MKYNTSIHMRIRSGFSLIEVVLTLIIGALLLTTASYYLYSILNIYERTRKNPGFDEHVQNVTLFLSNALLQANDAHYIYEVSAESKEGNPTTSNEGTPPQKPKPKKKAKTSEYPTIAWKHLPEASEHEPYFLSFTFYTGNPLISFPKFPRYPTIAYLELVPDEGLYLIWHLSKTYYKEEPLPVYRTLISPYAKKLEYFYFDKDRDEWSNIIENPESENAAKNIPKMIRITFIDGSNSETGTILINSELSLEEFL